MTKIKKDFEVLLSTVDSKVTGIDMYPAVIINQISSKEHWKKKKNVYNYFETGISKSRNRAIKHADAKICLISDDDVSFKDRIDKKIIQSFESHPKADIITFQIETPEGKPYKNYPSQKRWHDLQSLMNVSSVEIAFKRERIEQINLRFDEMFGIGSVFPTGEEYIFLTDALKKELNILYLPIPIVIHPQKDWNTIINDQSLQKAKGAMFYRVYGWKALYFCFLISLKKALRSETKFFRSLASMLKGIAAYQRHRSLN